MSGRIIFLNGSSSAGKTTLAHSLQNKLETPWFHIGLDQFRDGMPSRYRGMNAPAGTPGYAGLNVVPVTLGDQRATEIRFGDVGQKMLHGMHRAIAAFVVSGNDVIIEDLILHPKILKDYLVALRDQWVLFVAVRCPIEVVQERETMRPGRFPGTAHSHYGVVHAHNDYDLEVDTSVMSSHQCADKIVDYLASNPKPKSFQRLYQKILP